nr:MAG TPA: hypothetical protein [Caudoviricetes sp.]
MLNLSNFSFFCLSIFFYSITPLVFEVGVVFNESVARFAGDCYDTPVAYTKGSLNTCGATSDINFPVFNIHANTDISLGINFPFSSVNKSSLLNESSSKPKNENLSRPVSSKN